MSYLSAYTDQERDHEAHLMYYDARYYHPILKRFTSADPWQGDVTNPQTMNKYSYVMNNPLMYNDPSGNVMHAVGRPVDATDSILLPDHEYGTHWFVRFDNNPLINEGRKTTIGGYTDNVIIGELFREENYSTDFGLDISDYTDIVKIDAPAPYTQNGYEKMIYDKYMNAPKYEGKYTINGGELTPTQGNSGNVFTQIMLDAGYGQAEIKDTFNTWLAWDAGVGRLSPRNDPTSDVSTKNGPILDDEPKPY